MLRILHEVIVDESLLSQMNKVESALPNHDSKLFYGFNEGDIIFYNQSVNSLYAMSVKDLEDLSHTLDMKRIYSSNCYVEGDVEFLQPDDVPMLFKYGFGSAELEKYGSTENALKESDCSLYNEDKMCLVSSNRTTFVIISNDDYLVIKHQDICDLAIDISKRDNVKLNLDKVHAYIKQKTTNGHSHKSSKVSTDPLQ